jgi:hypothetical protein
MPETDTEVIDAEAVEEADATQEIRSQELVIHEERSTALQPQTYLPTPKEWEAITAIAVRMAGTQFVPESYRGKPDTVAAAILTGREMGIGPMQSLRDIHMIDGRPAFSAQLMLSKLRSGGVVIVESSATAERAYIKARRSDTGEEGEFEFTKADAEAAGLLGKKNYRQWPSDMMWARAVGRMARRFGSDLLGGLVYTKEELEDIDDHEGGYGVGSGYDASSDTEFDPGKHLLEGVVRGSDKGAVAELDAKMKAMNAHVDWRALIGLCVQAEYEVEDRSKLTTSQRDEWWFRLRNAVVKLEQSAADFDSQAVASPTQVKEAFAWAFPKFDGDVPMIEAVVEEVSTDEGDDEPAPLPALTPEEDAKIAEAADQAQFGD